MKQPVKCWECGGHNLRWDFPMREYEEGNSYKVPRLQDKMKVENQQENLMEAEGLGPESSKQLIEHGADLKILKF